MFGAAFSTVWTPTRSAARISMPTDRDALKQAMAAASARLSTRAIATRPIRRHRSDIARVPPLRHAASPANFGNISRQFRELRLSRPTPVLGPNSGGTTRKFGGRDAAGLPEARDRGGRRIALARHGHRADTSSCARQYVGARPAVAARADRRDCADAARYGPRH